MRTIGIPQLYCGASGQKGAYNRQEVGLARAFASLGCRAVVLSLRWRWAGRGSRFSRKGHSRWTRLNTLAHRTA